MAEPPLVSRGIVTLLKESLGVLNWEETNPDFSMIVRSVLLCCCEIFVSVIAFTLKMCRVMFLLLLFRSVIFNNSNIVEVVYFM